MCYSATYFYLKRKTYGLVELYGEAKHCTLRHAQTHDAIQWSVCGFWLCPHGNYGPHFLFERRSVPRGGMYTRTYRPWWMVSKILLRSVTFFPYLVSKYCPKNILYACLHNLVDWTFSFSDGCFHSKFIINWKSNILNINSVVQYK